MSKYTKEKLNGIKMSNSYKPIMLYILFIHQCLTITSLKLENKLNKKRSKVSNHIFLHKILMATFLFLIEKLFNNMLL